MLASKNKLGIIGGMGTRATWKFCEILTDLFKAEKEWDYPPMIVYLATQTPSRTRALLYNEESPVKYLINRCVDVGSLGANLIAIPCNSSHYWYEEVSLIIKSHGLVWLNMIDIVKQSISMQGTLVVGGYAVMEKKLYGEESSYPIKEYEVIAQMLEELRQGKPITNINLFNKLIDEYKPNRILMACTELALLPKELNISCEVYDSSYIYASKIVEILK